ncbi:superoxide dismutase [Ochrobactrum sp. MYb379]|uniref:superoxide dismutase n=1 Tax=Ochrobactrum sp. MYb379 TaxID=2745275 RepID=UPI00309C6559
MNTLNRRNFLTITAGVTAFAAATKAGMSKSIINATSADTSALFVLPPLPYSKNALERSIDTQTMTLHHDFHHATYVNNLNKAANAAPQILKYPIEYLLANLNNVPESVRATVRNNLGGHANHSMFWQIMSGDSGNAHGEVLAAINRDLGGLDKLKTDFDMAGSRIFGSGWVFVTVTQDGKLAIETRSNQDTPLMDNKRVLFGNDVWEHAYYLRYQNRRNDYLEAWWDVINWAKINERYIDAKKGVLGI